MSVWLAPLGWLFGGLAASRVALYRRGVLRQARLAGPVISVGNLSVGGTGKTPLVARIAEILRDEGLAVAVLSRGYRGRFRGPALLVGDGQRVLCSARDAGDEPVMLARALPGVAVAVGARRDRVGRWVEARLGPRVHVLDDGFQHLRLARDLDLLCIDALDPDGRPLPAGRLREFASAAGRADAVLLTHCDRATPETLARLERRFGPERTFRVQRRFDGFFDLRGRPTPAPRRPFLFCGIASPRRFEEDVRARVGTLAGSAAFADHHAWSPAEIERVFSRGRASGADALVTTAKDAVRLPEGAGAQPGASQSAEGRDLPILVFHVAAEIEDEDRLRQRLLAVARRGGLGIEGAREKDGTSGASR